MKRIISVILIVIFVMMICPISGTELYAEDVLVNVQTIIPYATPAFVAWLLAQMASMGIEFDSLSDFNDRLQTSQFQTWISGQWSLFQELDTDGDGLYMPEDPLTYAIFGNNELNWYFAKYAISEWWQGVQILFKADDMSTGAIETSVFDGHNFIVQASTDTYDHFLYIKDLDVPSLFAEYYMPTSGTYTYNILGDEYTIIYDKALPRLDIYKNGVNFGYTTSAGSNWKNRNLWCIPYIGWIRSDGSIGDATYSVLGTVEDVKWRLQFFPVVYSSYSDYRYFTALPVVKAFQADALTESAISNVDEDILNSELPEALLRESLMTISVQAQMIQDLMDALSGEVTVPATDVEVPSITNTYVTTTNEYIQTVSNTLPTTGEINFPKLPDLELPSIVLRDKFPFCIPFDLANALTLLSSDPVAPEFDIPIKIERLGVDESLHLDLDEFEPIVNIMKWLILLAFSVSLIVATRKLIKG